MSPLKCLPVRESLAWTHSWCIVFPDRSMLRPTSWRYILSECIFKNNPHLRKKERKKDSFEPKLRPRPARGFRSYKRHSKVLIWSLSFVFALLQSALSKANKWQRTATHCKLQQMGTHWNIAIHCKFQQNAVYNTLVLHCNPLQYTAIHCTFSQTPFPEGSSTKQYTIM